MGYSVNHYIKENKIKEGNEILKKIHSHPFFKSTVLLSFTKDGYNGIGSDSHEDFNLKSTFTKTSRKNYDIFVSISLSFLYKKDLLKDYRIEKEFLKKPWGEGVFQEFKEPKYIKSYKNLMKDCERIIEDYEQDIKFDYNLFKFIQENKTEDSPLNYVKKLYKNEDNIEKSIKDIDKFNLSEEERYNEIKDLYSYFNKFKNKDYENLVPSFYLNENKDKEYFIIEKEYKINPYILSTGDVIKIKNKNYKIIDLPKSQRGYFLMKNKSGIELKIKCSEILNFKLGDLKINNKKEILLENDTTKLNSQIEFY